MAPARAFAQSGDCRRITGRAGPAFAVPGFKAAFANPARLS